MRTIIKEIILTGSRLHAARIECPPGLIPEPGQYLLASVPGAVSSPLPTVLFPGGFQNIEDLKIKLDDGTLLQLSPPIPDSWTVGMTLQIRKGPGKGFCLPEQSRRLLVVAADTILDRLLPLAAHAVDRDLKVTICSDALVPDISPAIEYYPLDSAHELVGWADYTAIGIPASQLTILRDLFRLPGKTQLSSPAQVLVDIPMPCGGVGECGACAVHSSSRRTLFACKEGPVFDLNELDW